MADCIPLYKRAAFMLSVSLDNKFEKSTVNMTTMDPTTLVTFLFKAPAEARSIELLGSWDNFSRPYRMQHDRRRGSRFWTGCFKFSNIIFDGDGSSWSKPRTGGLKQGGTYWYYYRINDDVETHDSAQPHTTVCPLLPGQTLNVIDVPIEFVEPPIRSRSASVDATESLASLSSTHTLDPDDKFNALQPPPVSKVHIRCVSDLALNGRLESQPHLTREHDIAPKPGSPSRIENGKTVENMPSGRYYSQGCFADDRSSISSRRSWRSAAPSFANSSVIDAYGFEVTDHNGLYSFLDDQSPASHISTSHQDAQIDEVDFDFEHDDVDCSDPRLSPDENVEFHLNLQTNLSASHLASIEEEQENASVTCPSRSRHDHRIDVARPTTSYSSQDWRPRLFSRMSSEHHCDETDSFGPASQSGDQPFEIERGWPITHPTTSLSDTDHETTEFWSPTFSVTTVSSGGINTPFRLSQGCTRTTSGHASTDDSIQDVADRLRSLGSDDHELTLPSPIIEGEESNFTAYALPQNDAGQSVQSLGKMSSGKTSILQDPPPVDLMPELRESSFADDIFSELTYFGSSIS